MNHKIKILTNTLIGIVIKYVLKLKKSEPLPKNERVKDRIIISVTSYGRRVKETLPYTLLSLLNQTMKPDKILVWLDNSWNDMRLNKRLKKLTEKGVEFRYCEDIKSYKKLIPTLRQYPNDIIITVDDDIIYSKYLIENLFSGYSENRCIQCTIGMQPIKLLSGSYDTYNNWIERRGLDSILEIIPIGAGGVLYPPNTLSDDVLSEDSFKLLAPQADDLWFWVMAKRNHTKHSIRKLKGQNYSFDAFYQLLHRGSALTHSNSGEAKNDIQLKNILGKYPID